MGVALPVEIKIELDPRTRRKLEMELRGIKNGFPKAMSKAVNQTAKTATVRISQEVRKIIRVSKRSADQRLKIRGRATPLSASTTVSVLRPLLDGRRTAPLLTSFKGTKDTRVFASGKRKGGLKRGRKGQAGRGQGVVARPRVKGGEQRLKHAFIITGKGGVPVPVVRAGFGSQRAGRKPLVPMLGPTVQGIYQGTPGLRRRVEGDLLKVLEKNMLSQVDRLLKRRR